MKNNLDAFAGFTPETIQFFKDIAENNYKEWFEEHRHIYENSVLKPLKQLVIAISPAMHNIDPTFELRPHRVVSRIYRDTRFSKNKDPYKNRMWMSFSPPVKEWENIPGYFMELSAEKYMVGMGLFMPKKKTMDNLRDSVAYDAKDFKINTQLILDNGYSIGGDEYKRPIKNDLPEYYQQWVQRKSLYVFKEFPIGKELYSTDFVEVLQKEFESLAWLYNFLKDE